jgi:hypothetical protein
MAYVGPPAQYDFMGATQFRLLCTLGLRANHNLLDFGCGSLRAGRLFISYLDAKRYFGIEPNRWLIEEAVRNQVGEDLIRLKEPRFDHNSDFLTNVFSETFDFIVAQSIFSHTGRDLVHTTLRNFRASLKPDGLIVATFKEGETDFDGDGWVYSGCEHYKFHTSKARGLGVTPYRASTIHQFAADVGLFGTRIPWYHPRQAWYLFSTNKKRLPSRSMLRHLTGVVLFDPEFVAGLRKGQRIITSIKHRIKRHLPAPVVNGLKKFMPTNSAEAA